MGLDTVELVMAVEEAFNLRIPDAVAAKLYTVGELHGYVVSELQRREGPAVDPVEVYETLRKLIVRQLGVPPSAVTPV